MQSLPSWEAWIEVMRSNSASGSLASRFPHGKRGLKCVAERKGVFVLLSLPSWEAWIEVNGRWGAGSRNIVASLMGSVD